MHPLPESVKTNFISVTLSSALIKRGHTEVSPALLPYKKTGTPPSQPNKPNEDESLGSQVSIPACLWGGAEEGRCFVSHPPFVRVPPVINLDLVNSP